VLELGPYQFRIVKKATMAKFEVEKRIGTPYCTRSCLLGGAASKLGGEKAGLSPPCSLLRKAARKRCCFELVRRLGLKEPADRSQVKEPKEIGYGKQQAGAEHPGFLP
jgi:hypothetical protein